MPNRKKKKNNFELDEIDVENLLGKHQLWVGRVKKHARGRLKEKLTAQSVLNCKGSALGEWIYSDGKERFEESKV